jgi:ABC-type Fe3+-hydroxamate transport system substrate-binding protein
MRGVRRSLALAALAMALAIALAACGGGSGGSGSGGSASGGGEKTEYTNAQYGFTLMYGEPLSVVTLTPTSGEQYAIAFADKDGPLVNDEYANGLRVSVIGLDQAIKARDVPKLQKALQQSIEKMVTGIPDGKLTSKVAPIDINGTPGYSVDYQFTKGGEQLTCTLYILVKGKNEFDLTTQAVAADWDSLKGTLQETVQSFTLE